MSGNGSEWSGLGGPPAFAAAANMCGCEKGDGSMVGVGKGRCAVVEGVEGRVGEVRGVVGAVAGAVVDFDEGGGRGGPPA